MELLACKYKRVYYECKSSSTVKALYVGKKNNVIEINGKRYDARTGALLDLDATPVVNSVNVPTKIASTSIDGFIKAPSKTVALQPQSSLSPAEIQAKLDYEQRQQLKKGISARKVAAHATHTPEPAKTLMRSAVKKPGPSLKRRVKAQAPISGLIAPPSHSLAAKVAAHAVNPQHSALAAKVPKSSAIRRFSPQTAAAPAKQPAVVAAPAPEPRYRPPTPQPKRPRTTADILHEALKNATSHEEPTPQKTQTARRKYGYAGAGIALSVALIAVIGMQNISGIKLQLASAKAGISASLPTIQPAGYRTDNVSQSPGSVTVRFASNSDRRTYTIQQSVSSWDSATLRDTYVSKQDKAYQTVEAGGRTIYLYGNGQATWVSNNIWYVVQSHGALSNRQLVDIATSM